MKKTSLKFIGSAALIITTLGLLLSILGQLDFIGSERSETVAVKTQQKSDDKPKYSFYNELKKRKVEVDEKKGTVTNRAMSVAPTKKGESHNKSENNKDKSKNASQYVVQAGALSQKNDAERVKQSLIKLGYAVRIVKLGRKHLVQVGPLQGKKTAITVERELKSKNYPTLIKRLK